MIDETKACIIIVTKIFNGFSRHYSKHDDPFPSFGIMLQMLFNVHSEPIGAFSANWFPRTFITTITIQTGIALNSVCNAEITTLSADARERVSDSGCCTMGAATTYRTIL